MRKLFGLTLSFLITCASGVSVSELRDEFFPRQVSLCMLARNPGAYHRKVVQVRASGSVVSSRDFERNQLIIYQAGWAAPEAGAAVEFEESYQPPAEVEAFISYPKREIRNGSFVVTGQFDQAASMRCYGPRFAIIATRVELECVLPSEPLPTRRGHTVH